MSNLKIIHVVLFLLINNVFAAPVLFTLGYRRADGKAVHRHKTGNIPDNQVQAVVDGMEQWSNGQYKAWINWNNKLQVYNPTLYANREATEGRFDDMAQIIANHIQM
ncbi:hypothetical protein K461DRAFT_272063 [Myriangium duriaei CBS 260.36]|uniref:Uncharacterized protein n=1 Tax=Myriangium duriaei CBS 260.36 TaxID=1168546 RepID=A0A9P4MCC5_9PEZI|nr:hypothetical protein K461DRAFT_272063 [Myriangium duriaei CBS 260.36]